jgi:hypothetical protein
MMDAEEVALMTDVPDEVQGSGGEAHDGSGSLDR